MGEPVEETTGRVPAPHNVRIAGALVALQGVVAAVVAVVLAVRAVGDGGPRLYYGLAEAGMFLLLAAAVAGVGYGLVRGVHGCRSPAIVIELLLFGVVYSLLGPSHQLVWGIVVGLVVLATFLLLISEQSRQWSMGDEYPGRRGRREPGQREPGSREPGSREH
ncbi:hypothetical protein [Pseudonocardia phyllosphaerae]|uniref:hypothetical protein n=1 Tax=Pseudonocardia phyllosphaerae TaxID=3390502 RepID=UPI00397A9ABE